MFIDTAKIYLKAGDGGDGCNSFYRDRAQRVGKPDGGEGGDGGNIILQADINSHTLLDFAYNRHFSADSGKNGSSNHKAGRGGKDRIVRIPRGTIIYDDKTNDLLRDLTKDGEQLKVCKGGRGGRGNSRGRISTYGETGEERNVRLELKLIADIGLLGFPNAGKSTFISRVSDARPKIASYPFTTKEPNLGVVRYYDDSFVVADIPGITEGAHSGKGLGDTFLRHIERTKVLIHIIDMAAVDCRDPLSDYYALNKELKLYSEILAKKPQFIAANKMDLYDAAERLASFKKKVKKTIYPISAQTGKGVDILMKAVFTKLMKARDKELKVE